VGSIPVLLSGSRRTAIEGVLSLEAEDDPILVVHTNGVKTDTIVDQLIEPVAGGT
jgi:hypothetical protein